MLRCGQPGGELGRARRAGAVRDPAPAGFLAEPPPHRGPGDRRRRGRPAPRRPGALTRPGRARGALAGGRPERGRWLGRSARRGLAVGAHRGDGVGPHTDGSADGRGACAACAGPDQVARRCGVARRPRDGPHGDDVPRPGRAAEPARIAAHPSGVAAAAPAAVAAPALLPGRALRGHGIHPGPRRSPEGRRRAAAPAGPADRAAPAAGDGARGRTIAEDTAGTTGSPPWSVSACAVPGPPSP
ncbi:hypothetical protein RKD31_005882 [Streptomyces sp. SAI-163]